MKRFCKENKSAQKNMQLQTKTAQKNVQYYDDSVTEYCLRNEKSKRNPPPGRLLATMEPPWNWTACFTMERPSPVPPF